MAIQSDYDPNVSAQYSNQLKDKLGAKIIIKHNAGHIDDEEIPCKELLRTIPGDSSPKESC